MCNYYYTHQRTSIYTICSHVGVYCIHKFNYNVYHVCIPSSMLSIYRCFYFLFKGKGFNSLGY